jgi:hypothetical protein
MKQLMKRALGKVRQFLLAPLLESHRRLEGINQSTQLLLYLRYKEMMQANVTLPSMEEVGFRVFSENDEDGILLFIFSVIGVTNKKVIDLGAASISNSNTANLIVNHGWVGMLIDGNYETLKGGKEFYYYCPDTRNFPPTLVHAWITAENVNGIISEHGFSGEIDLLSIDLDGVDYWIWKAIDCVDARVVVIEYQDIIGPEKSLTVPYDPDFKGKNYEVNRGVGNYSGASLPALVKLAREKGYRLVGCNRYGYNAFFVRAGIAEEYLQEITIESCFRHPKVVRGMKERFPRVENMEWKKV